MKEVDNDIILSQSASSQENADPIAILEDFSKDLFNANQVYPMEKNTIIATEPSETPKEVKKITNKPVLLQNKLIPPVLTKENLVPDTFTYTHIAQEPKIIELKDNALDIIPVNIEKEIISPAQNSEQTAKKKSKALPEILAGRYKLERLLGVGGMCVVYRAYDILGKHFGNPSPYVALKTFTEEFAEYPDANHLLYSEYALTAKLCHLNIVSVYQFDVDSETERAFITLELLKGTTLEQWLIENPLGVIWKHAASLIFSLLEILAYSHQQGILHGDLKPSNIMLTHEGIKLFDYGLGQAITGDMAKLPKIARERFNAWTPRYAAPELLEGSPLSEKTDLFALCCIIYEILSGKNPYFQDNSRKITNTPKRPKTISKAAWRAICCGLALDPAQRNITIAELIAVLRKQPRFILF